MSGSAESRTPLLEVRDLSIFYEKQGSFGRRKPKPVVHDVSFEIYPGETFGLVGESGSGKSTIGRAILRLLEPAEESSIRFDGREITEFGRTTPLTYRADVQAVFQDPATSLNPRKPVSAAVTAALKCHGVEGAAERERRAAEVFERVGLRPEHLPRYPGELSGGQQQRVAIARALVLHPRLVVCDEALSALDLSTQNHILDLLIDLQLETGMSYLFIGHNLEIMEYISDRMAVLRLGRIVEMGDSHEVFADPQDAYTRRLLGATPAEHPQGRAERREVRRAFAARAAQREAAG